MFRFNETVFSLSLVLKKHAPDKNTDRQRECRIGVSPLKKIWWVGTGVLLAAVTTNVTAMGKPDRGGGDSGGDTSIDCTAVEFFIVPGDLVSDSDVSGWWKRRAYTGVEDWFSTFVGGALPPESGCTDPIRYGFVETDPTAPSARSSPIDFLGYSLVFEDNFDSSPDNPDLSNTFNSRKWSSKYPFSTDAKINTIPGEDDHWNVNTTGRYPGETNYSYDSAPSTVNFFNNPSEIDFLDTLFDIPEWGADDESTGTPVFENSDGTLRITAYENPEPLRRINDEKGYLSGLISSAANPDPTKKDSVGAHGFEFRYGYVEARAKLPVKGNGFRAALWLYSDNAFFNQVSSNNNVTHEIDFMEYLPNTPVNSATPSYQLQTSLFGGVDNLGRDDGWKIMTYDTIFHAYHYNNNAKRTPTNWTFNGEARYQARRETALGESSMDGSVVQPPQDQFHKFAVLWLPEKIEWYVNDVLIHRAVPAGPDAAEIPGFQSVVDHIFNKRMYIIANLAMGLDVFEGPMDVNAYEDGKGPSFEIDYIRVYQNTENAEHVRCGINTNEPCNTTIGVTDSSDEGGTGGRPPGKGKPR